MAASLPSLSFRIDRMFVAEGAGSARVLLVLSSPLGMDLQVDYSTSLLPGSDDADATATPGLDFVAATSSLVIPAGQTSAEFFINIVDDALREDLEHFFVHIAAPADLVQVHGPALPVFIADNDAPVLATPVVNLIAALEGGALNTMVLAAHLSSPAPAPLRISITPRAVDNLDLNGLVVPDILVPQGETSGSVNVDASGVTLRFPTQGASLAFTPQLEGPGRMADPGPVVAVVPPDTPPAEPQLSVSDTTVGEDGFLATVKVTLTRNGYTGTVGARVVLLPINATPGGDTDAPNVDYISRVLHSSSLYFAPDEVEKFVDVRIVDDKVVERPEQFQVVLVDVVDAEVAKGSGTVTIIDNDGVRSAGSAAFAYTATDEFSARSASALNIALPLLSIADVVTNEAAGYAEVLVQMDIASTQIVSVTLASSFTTNINTIDYDRLYGGVLAFAPGETAKVVRIALTDDFGAERPESFRLTLSAPVNAEIAHPKSLVTIARGNQTPGVPSLSVAGVSVDESAGLASFVLVLDGPASQTVTVDWTTVAGTASAGSDFVARNGSTGFAFGQTSQVITVPIHDDSVAEGDEYFSLRLSNAAGAKLGADSATARIVANDGLAVATPTVRVENVVADEWNGYADITVRLSAPSSQPFTVYLGDAVALSTQSFEYSSYGGTSVANAPAALVFAPGQTSQTARYALHGDDSAEAAESFYLLLLNPLAAPATGFETASVSLFTIAANGAATGTPVLQIDNPVLDEKSGAAIFQLRLDRPSTQTVSVLLSTADINATAGSDYVAQSQRVSFGPGQTLQTFTVPLIDDATAEGDELFMLVPSLASGLLLPPDVATARIVANDNGVSTPLPVINFELGTANESQGYIDLVARLSSASSSTVSFALTVTDATVSFGSDYETYGNGFTLRFEPGSTLQSFRIPLADDSAAEGVEAIKLLAGSASGALIGTPWATALIGLSDRDAAAVPNPTVVGSAVTEGEVARFIVSLQQAPSAPVQYSYSFLGGTAGAADIAQRSGTVTFAAGQTLQVLEFPALDDSAVESDETVQLLLTHARANVAMAAGSLTIVDNDAAPQALPQITLQSVNASEEAGFATLQLRLSAPSALPVSVRVADAAGTTGGAADYASNSAAVFVFAPGEMVKNLRYALLDDSVPEASEAFQVLLSNAVNATLANTSATVTITDSDGAPAVTVVSDKAGVVANGPITFTYTFAGAVTGFAAEDFNASPGTVSSAGALAGSSTVYTAVLQPPANFEGQLLMTLAANAVSGGNGRGNLATHVLQAADTRAPTVATFSPADGASGVVAGTTITLTFSEPVQRPAVTPGGPKLHLMLGSVEVQAFDAATNTTQLNLAADGRTLTVTPSAPLAPSSNYRLVIDSGALRDLPGNPIAAVDGYDFTTAVNLPPVAANGNATLDEDSVLNGLLPAASDGDGDTISYALGAAAANGQVLINANGSYRYTPGSNFNGSDEFSFRVSDNRGGSNLYTMSVTVAPVNDAPTGAVLVTGIALTGQSLSADATGIADVDGLGAISYQWLRAGVAIAGATGSQYLLLSDDVGMQISVRASYTDGAGTAESVSSAASSAVAGFEPLVGSSGSDSLVGSPRPDDISGLGGNDTLLGGDGRDSLRGGDGDDVLDGGPGIDTIDGGAGLDIVSYPGSSFVTIDLQAQRATRGGETDVLAGIEAFFGSGGIDSFSGAEAAANQRSDTVRGGAGDDVMDGRGGNDTAEYTGARAGYVIQRDGDVITVRDSSPANGDEGTDTLRNFERLVFADKLVAFGARAEEIARVAFVLWTPDIVGSTTLFARGLSYYDVGYDFATMCSAALGFWSEQGPAFAQLLRRGAPGTTKTEADLLATMAHAGGGEAGRVAALAEMANDPATTAQLTQRGVLVNGVVADLSVEGFGTLFGLLPG